MNAIRTSFLGAAQPDILPPYAPQILIFTARDMPEGDGRILPLVCDANQKPGAIMTAIAEWLNEYNVFDQRHLHGDNWSQFKITGYCQYNNSGGHRSIMSDVFLMEHLFANCRDHTPGSFDEFMRILDRHKLAEEMYRDLLYYKEYEPPMENARLWLEGFRTCCHPDHPRDGASVMIAVRPAVPARVAVPA